MADNEARQGGLSRPFYRAWSPSFARATPIQSTRRGAGQNRTDRRVHVGPFRPGQAGAAQQAHEGGGPDQCAVRAGGAARGAGAYRSGVADAAGVAVARVYDAVGGVAAGGVS